MNQSYMMMITLFLLLLVSAAVPAVSATVETIVKTTVTQPIKSQMVLSCATDADCNGGDGSWSVCKLSQWCNPISKQCAPTLPPTSKHCTAPNVNSCECGPTAFCKLWDIMSRYSNCTLKGGIGAKCAVGNQCQSGFCSFFACSNLIPPKPDPVVESEIVFNTSAIIILSVGGGLTIIVASILYYRCRKMDTQTALTNQQANQATLALPLTLSEVPVSIVVIQPHNQSNNSFLNHSFQNA
jgi:hypothetical protein